MSLLAKLEEALRRLPDPATATTVVTISPDHPLAPYARALEKHLGRRATLEELLVAADLVEEHHAEG